MALTTFSTKTTTLVLVIASLSLLWVLACSLPASENQTTSSTASDFSKPSRSELRKRLSPIQYKVTQNEATEPSFRNAYWNQSKTGEYKCIVCDRSLFTSKTKFKSGTGWPSFYAPVSGDAVGTKTDYKMILPRTEVHCSRCKAHLGHVFNDGPAPTGLRYCMNSASLSFEEATDEPAPTIAEISPTEGPEAVKPETMKPETNGSREQTDLTNDSAAE